MELMTYKTLYICIVCLLVVVLLETWVLTRPSEKRTKLLKHHVNTIVGVIIFICANYIWRRLTILTRGRTFLAINTLFKGFTFVVLVMAQFAMVMGAFWTSKEPPFVSIVSTMCFGTVIFMTTSLVIFDVCSYIIRALFCSRKTKSIIDRTEIKIRVLLALLSTFLLLIIGTMVVNSLTVQDVTVKVKGLNPKLNGTTIVQICDIHLGPFNGQSRLKSIVDRVNTLRGDVVVITGDLVDSSVDALHEAVKPLSDVQSKYGVYYVTGNHEYYTGDVDSWLNLLPHLNVTPLVNQRVCLPATDTTSCNDGFYLAGLEDIEARRLRYGAHSMDIHAALSGRTKGVPTVVLAHQPWAAVEAIVWDDVRLVLSGHTHAGQFFPFMLFIYLFNPFFVGLYEPRPGVYVYVNPGTVYYLVPFRHYRPEITYITLVSI